MARSTGSGAVEAIQRQVRRVRWRRNLRDLQRALYLLIAVGTGGATALVLLALTASPRLFARAVAAIAAATLGAALVIVRDARRRWIPGDRAALWIDHRGGLTGRLATLVELRRREEAEPPLLALLVEQNVARLALWRPDRLVPRRVPRAALAAAAGGVTLLALVVALAPRLRRPAPELVAGEVSARPLEGVEPSGERLAVAPIDADDEDTGGMPDAGTQPDPHLFGPPSSGAAATSQRFALSLAARVHAGRGGPGEAADPPRAPAANAPTDLAAGQRAEAAVPRMPVPPRYEALVRRHFGREGL